MKNSHTTDDTRVYFLGWPKDPKKPPATRIVFRPDGTWYNKVIIRTPAPTLTPRN